MSCLKYKKEANFSYKPDSSYTNGIKKEINLLQLDKNSDNVKVIGSASYRKTLYPSDLDFFELIKHGQTKEDCVDFFKYHLQRILSDVSKKKEHYFMEVKCGWDKRYDINIGECHNNIYTMNSKLPDILHVMFDLQLFSAEEMETFEKILNEDSYDQLTYETIAAIIRKHYIVRWTAKEISQGWKHLPNSVDKYMLEDAISVKSPINIEILAIVNYKISDVSNFFVLTYSQDDKTYTVNISEDSVTDFHEFMNENLKSSIEKLYYSKLDFQPLKVAKRLFSLARFNHNEALLTKVYPLLNSDIGFIGQIKSEIGTLSKAAKVKGIPIKIFKNQLQQIKYRLSNVMFINIDELETINKAIDEACAIEFDPDAIIEILDGIKKILTTIINKNADCYLRMNSLAPPVEFLPKKRVF